MSFSGLLSAGRIAEPVCSGLLATRNKPDELSDVERDSLWRVPRVPMASHNQEGPKEQDQDNG